MKIISDNQIIEFIKEEKLLPKNFKPNFRLRNNQNFFEKEIIGKNGNKYKIIIRQSIFNPLDFSIIFGVMINGILFRLKRYNGDSHDHTNKIENEVLEGFHIHMATERYQENGFREEGYAKKSQKYNDWQSAFNVMIKENNFKIELDKGQMRLE